MADLLDIRIFSNALIFLFYYAEQIDKIFVCLSVVLSLSLSLSLSIIISYVKTCKFIIL